MSGYEGGYSAGGGISTSRAIARRPVPTRQSVESTRTPTVASTEYHSGPTMAYSSHRFAQSQEGRLPVSPASSGRGSPAPEAREDRERRYHQNGAPVGAQQRYDWHTLPSQQQHGAQESASPGVTDPRQPKQQWRQSYRADPDTSDNWQDPRPSRGVSWQAAPQADPSSQSPPNPSYQEISATVSQRREDREQEMASRLLPTRELSWLGSQADNQAPNPNYNEVLAATSQWRRNPNQEAPALEDGGLGIAQLQAQHPKQSDPSTAETGHAPYRSRQPYREEELPAGTVLGPPNQSHQQVPGAEEHIRQAAARRDLGAREQPEVSPVAVTSWQAVPTMHAPQPVPLRIDIPTAPEPNWQGRREQEELRRARQASWQGVAQVSQASYAQQDLGQTVHTETRGADRRPDTIVPASQAQFMPQQQSPQRPEQARDGGRGPFMHYEDYTFFDPNISPKDELQTQGIRAADTFSTVPDSAVRPQARQSWGRQRRKQTGDREKPWDGRVGRPKSCSQEYIFPWIPELLWCLLSILCLVVIAVVLQIFEGHALPSWPLGITLNALVAFLATLCKAAFVVPIMEGLSQLKWNWFARGERPLADFAAFENASRNPVGWAHLLFMARGRALGVCAAVVLLTSLVSSPLTQLLINYPTRFATTTSTASVANVPRSEAYHYPELDQTAHQEVDMRHKRAVHEAIYHATEETVPHITPTCSSSECRWERFSSLAVCVSTADVSDKLTTSSPMMASQLGIDFGEGYDAPVRKASLPNGAFLVGGTDSYSLNISAAAEATDSDSSAWTSLAFADESDVAHSTLANFFIIYTEHTLEEGRPAFRAVETGLRFCVNTYEVVVSQGVARTTLVDSTTDVIPAAADETHMHPVRGERLSSPGSATLHSRNDGTSYDINGDHAKILREYLESVFVGTFSSVKHGAQAARSTAASDALGSAMYRREHVGGTMGSASEDERRAVIGNVMHNLATSLTNVIRADGTTQAGVVLVPESYVEVRWPWLAFLAAQVFLAVVFLASIMAQTAVWRVKVLKGSTAATLFAIGAEDKVLLERQHLGIIEDETEMARQAGRITGKFSISDRGWMLNLGRHGAGVS